MKHRLVDEIAVDPWPVFLRSRGKVKLAKKWSYDLLFVYAQVCTQAEKKVTICSL
jgi:hypothetical protein